VVVAMGLAGLVNLAMLVLAARLFFGEDLSGVDTLEGAHARSRSRRGGRRPGLRRRAAGLRLRLERSRHLRRSDRDGRLPAAQIPLLLRRAITMAPALLVLAAGVDPTGRS
jgi:manganese transport protein